MIDEFAKLVVLFVGRWKQNKMLRDIGVGLKTARGVAQLNVNRLVQEVVRHLTHLDKQMTEIKESALHAKRVRE